MAIIRVLLPYHLQTLARTEPEVKIQVNAPHITVTNIIHALENEYPMLRGAIFEHGSGKRRPLIRFFACAEDVSNNPSDQALPDQIHNGNEPFMIVGAIAGG